MNSTASILEDATCEVYGVIHMLVSRINAEIQLARGFEQQLEEFHRQFTRLACLLQGASTGEWITNPVMADWLQKINNAAFDADILLDEWSYKALKRRNENMFVQTVRRPFSRQAMAHKVTKMRKLIGSIFNDAKELGIKPIEAAAGEVYSGKLAHAIEKQDKKLSEQRQFVDLQLFRGRDDDVQKLVKLLCDPINTNSHLTVIGIVGFAGLGKTTLTKHISEIQEVADFFDNVIIWLVVSHNFDLIDLLHKMVENLFGEASGMKDGQALIGKLKTKMMEKKCLLILDDVWDTISWDSLKSTLQEIGVSKGTTILVTSRDKNLVEKLYTPERPIIHQLQALSPGYSWSLFMEKFYDGIVAGSEEEHIAKRMVDKCGGVPLAIRVLADLLRDKSIEEWREIEKSEIWTAKDKNGILPSLRLSYNYLPHIALKKCFAYCAIFEEDEVIAKQELIYMWMAQGFLQPNEKMECTGDCYFEHLLSCSLFQEVERDEYDRVKTFKMHDLVWTLARNVSRGECLRICSGKYDVTCEVRHLSIHTDSSELTSKLFPKLQTCHLKEDFLLDDSLMSWLTCKHLRVLNAGKQNGKINWEPLGSLIHLRYFAITLNDKNCLMKSNLPDQITKLYHLQTLRINLFFWSFNSSSRFGALFLKEFNNLVNLRHILSNSHIGIPVGVSHLTALQTLPCINVGLNWGGRISEIGCLTNLRGKLRMKALTLLTVEEARNLKLSSKSNLESLELSWCDDSSADNLPNPSANEILEALQPNVNMHEFELGGFDGTTFPAWLKGPGSSLNKIVRLTINECNNADENLSLESFTCLRILKVEWCEKLSIKFPNNRSHYWKFLRELRITYCHKVELPNLLLFPNIEVLCIHGNNSTSRDVLAGLGSLPHLRQLLSDLQVPGDLGEASPVCKSLIFLELNGSKYYGDATSLPEQLQYLVALRELCIGGFGSLEAVPNWLGKLTSLETLFLYEMPKLKQLPPRNVMLSLSKLEEFDCSGCPPLNKDFETKSGEWCKISHPSHKSRVALTACMINVIGFRWRIYRGPDMEKNTSSDVFNEKKLEKGH